MDSMETLRPDSSRSPSEARGWRTDIVQALETQRSRAQELLTTECDRIGRLEHTLRALVQELSSELQPESNVTSPRRAGLESELAELREALALTQQELALRTQQLESLRVAVHDQCGQDLLVEKATDAELRRLRAENHDLANRLAAAEHELRNLRGFAATSLEITATDSAWESLKKRLVAQLEADALEAESAATRITMEELVRGTDRVIAEKHNEIRSLRQVIEDQSRKIDGLVTGASAVAAMLNDDDIIRQERENLKTLELEWREKLRKAEVDISLERAKLAREYAILEERAREFEHSRPPSALNNDPAPTSKGRWLSRLGLSGGESDRTKAP